MLLEDLIRDVVKTKRLRKFDVNDVELSYHSKRIFKWFELSLNQSLLDSLIETAHTMVKTYDWSYRNVYENVELTDIVKCLNNFYVFERFDWAYRYNSGLINGKKRTEFLNNVQQALDAIGYAYKSIRELPFEIIQFINTDDQDNLRYTIKNQFNQSYQRVRRDINHRIESKFEPILHYFDSDCLAYQRPEPNQPLLYMIYGLRSKRIKIGRTKNWSGRQSLYAKGSINTNDDHFKIGEPIRLISYEYIDGAIHKLYASEKILKDKLYQWSSEQGTIHKYHKGLEWFECSIDSDVNRFAEKFNQIIGGINRKFSELNDAMNKDTYIRIYYK